MKLTKSHLKEIIKEVIKEEAVATVSLKKLIGDRVANLKANDLYGLTTALSQAGDPGDTEDYIRGILKKVAVTATPGGIQRAMKQFDDLYGKIMGPLDDPDYGFAHLPAEKVKAAARKLILRLATIATT